MAVTDMLVEEVEKVLAFAIIRNITIVTEIIFPKSHNHQASLTNLVQDTRKARY